MKNTSSVLMAALFLLISHAAFASGESTSSAPVVHECSIEPGWVDCGRAPGEYDYGCKVSCGTKVAECREATGFQTPDPWHSQPTQCDVIPSYCGCK